VAQVPNDAYTLSGTTLTFTSVPSSGTNNIYVRYLSTTTQSITPVDGIFMRAAVGSATLPAYSFIGDTNTGIFSPAADTIAFAEGGVESMRIDSSGNVGIGTTPSSSQWTGTKALQLGASAYLSGRTSNASGLIDISNNAYLNSTPAWAYTTTNGCSIYEQSNDTHIWMNAPSGTAGTTFTPTERMRIDSSGNVGIGTNSPADSAGFSRALDLNGASGAALYTRTNGSATNYTAFGNFGVDGYINNRGAGTLQFYNNNAERMRIDSSGNVGIGLTNPSSKLHVSGGTGNAVRVDGSSTGGAFLVMRNGGTTGGIANIGVWQGDTTPGTAIFAETGYDVRFYTNGTSTERMRIGTNGQLLVGTTTGTTLSAAVWRTTLSGSGNNLAVVNSSTDGSTTSGFQSSNYTVSGGNIINFYNGSGTFVAAISIPTNSSTGTTVTYGTGSDYRLKENVAPMIGALDKVQQLKPVTYTWKSNGYSGQGFIAHELQEIVPDCVVGEKDAVDKDGNIMPQMVDTSFLVATLTAAIQEQQQIINDLKARIETLEGAK
jgi:hypothetical protein